jgi:hypothetical protein
MVGVGGRVEEVYGLTESWCCVAGIAEQWHGSGSALLRVG